MFLYFSNERETKIELAKRKGRRKKSKERRTSDRMDNLSSCHFEKTNKKEKKADKKKQNRKTVSLHRQTMIGLNGNYELRIEDSKQKE